MVSRGSEFDCYAGRGVNWGYEVSMHVSRVRWLAILVWLGLVPFALVQSAMSQQQSTAQDKAAINHELHQTILKEHTGFKVGKTTDGGGPTYVFFDPQCEHCMYLWQQAKPLAGKYQLTWIPVNLLGEKSLLQGAALIGSKTPVKLMDQYKVLIEKTNETPPSKQGADGKGVLLPAESKIPSKALQDKVRANLLLLQKLGFDSVPFVVRYNEKTKTFSADVGGMTTVGLEDLLRTQ